MPGIQGGVKRRAGHTGEQTGAKAAGVEGNGGRALLREVRRVQVGDSVTVRTTRTTPNGNSVIVPVRAVVHSINQYGVVCLDLGKYKSCAYLQDLRDNAVVVV